MSNPGDVSYEAYIGTGAERGEWTITICRSVCAGVSGPFGEYPMEPPAEMTWASVQEAAAPALKAAGYALAGNYEPAGYAGVMVAPVRPIHS